MRLVPTTLVSLCTVVAFGLGGCGKSPSSTGIDRAAVKVTVAQSLEEDLSQEPYLNITVDSVFFSEIGPEQFEGHADVTADVKGLSPKIAGEKAGLISRQFYSGIRADPNDLQGGDAETKSLRQKLVSLDIYWRAAPGSQFRCRVPILVHVDLSAGENDVGVYVEYGDGEVIDTP